MSSLIPLSVERGGRTYTVALVGNPNTGKTTLFNVLTGFRQRVGNYAGVTVDKRTGRLRAPESQVAVEIIDLPGAYSLAARGEDEAILLDVLLGRQSKASAPDAILCVVDATNLPRNLFLLTQVLELGKPVVVALNMMDLAEARGVRVDVDALALEIGAPVVPIVANKQVGLAALKEAVIASLSAGAVDHCPAFPSCVCAELDGLCETLAQHAHPNHGPTTRVEALQTLLDPGGYHENRVVQRCGRGLAGELAERRRRILAAGESLVEVEAKVRYGWIDRVIEHVVRQPDAPSRSRTQLVDRVLTHRIAGTAIFLLLMGVCFQAIYSWAAPLMELIDGVFVSLGGEVRTLLPAGALQSLLADGVVSGVGAVLIFLPQILILFLFIAVMEDCGYMARAAFLIDRWMGLFGLGGQSFIPLLSSFACAVPGILATRTIDDRRDRFVTILIAPLMSCSARLPVYALLIGAFVPATPLLGNLVTTQAATLLAMYLVGVVVAVPVAWILKRTVLKGPPPSFLMELPSYKWPSASTVLYRMYDQGKSFVKSAGTIIFAVALIIWALGYYPHSPAIGAAHEAERAALRARHDAVVRETLGDAAAAGSNASLRSAADRIEALAARLEENETAFEASVERDGLDEGDVGWVKTRGEADASEARILAGDPAVADAAKRLASSRRELGAGLDRIDHAEAGDYLAQSYLGRAGRLLEPAMRPLGWDWKIGTGVIAAFLAREVVVATMGTIYNLGADQDERSVGLRTKLRDATWPDGRKVFGVPVALSIMVFFALCCQCTSTLAAIKRETKSWRWPVFAFSYMTASAYVAAFLVYQVAVRWS